MIYDYLKYTALAILTTVAAALAGCSSEATGPADDPGDMLTLRLNLSFSSGEESRAGNGEPDRYENPLGDFEKIDRLRVIIVHGVNATGTSGVVEANRLVSTDDQGYPMYDNLEFLVQANELKRIYLIANEHFLTVPAGSSETTPVKFLDSFAVDKTVDLTKLTDWTVSLPGISATTQTVSQGIFSPSSSTRLPLSESFDVFVDRTKAVDEVFHSSLFITRAAAKARFFLNTGDNFVGGAPEDLVGTRITAITLSGIGTTEYVFPNATAYSPSKYTSVENKERYITEFTTPADCRTVTYNVALDAPVQIVQPSDKKNRPITNSIYFPESILETGKQYIVGVQIDGKVWLYAPLETNILSVNGSDAIARDTYLPIGLIFNSAAELKVEVLPWDREDYYVDYTANVGVIGGLAFEGNAGQTGDYLSLDKLSAQLVLNYGKVARGSFTIASPLGYTWDAYLITTGGTQNAIQFQIPDPADNTKTITTTHISGEIGNPAEFGIVSTVAPGSEQNSAQLIVMATLATGTQVIVNILENWTSGNPGILTVIQNPV